MLRLRFGRRVDQQQQAQALINEPRPQSPEPVRRVPHVGAHAHRLVQLTEDGVTCWALACRCGFLSAPCFDQRDLAILSCEVYEAEVELIRNRRNHPRLAMLADSIWGM